MGHSPGESKDKKLPKGSIVNSQNFVFLISPIFEVVEIECRLFIVR
jgi:hypothetical protein